MNGRAFDAQVVLSPPDSKLGKLLQQYVCARVTRMDGIDLALFDFDRHNALYYFILNADEQIYMRYGGRDSESATTYLNLRSLELALEEGLRMHAVGELGEASKRERPEPLYPRDIAPLAQQTLRTGNCVECHLIADYQNIERERAGTLDKLRDMYRCPDIKKIGIYLKVPAGLVVESAEGAASEAGMQGGDRITHLNGIRVRTFGDLQYYYDRVPRDSKKIQLGVLRNEQTLRLDVRLPPQWWLTDLSYRHWSVDPLVFFATEPIPAEQIHQLDLPPNSFAGRVIDKDRFYDFSTPELKHGDIIFGVEGEFEDELARSPEVYIKLHHRAGSKVTIHVLRDGKRFDSELTTERQKFRKF